MICTSFMKPLGNDGRMGRSIWRAVRVALSLGRDSRLMNPPGILPAAYMRSSTSTVSGKKSWFSRISSRATAVTRTTVSSQRSEDGAVGLLGELAGLEGDGAPSDLYFDGVNGCHEIPSNPSGRPTLIGTGPVTADEEGAPACYLRRSSSFTRER